MLKNLERLKKACFLVGILSCFSNASLAADRYVATTGADVGDCSNIVAPCLTVQYAINQSVANDTIHVAAGTYPVVGLINVNKTLTFLGAQAGVDARTRVGPESVLSNTQGISVAANNVVFDGFTIQDSSNVIFTGYGLWINPGISGTQILNNIFQNNIVGLAISNTGTQALVQHNLFQNNNNPGGAFGTGIYTDEFVSGAVSNVLINENNFINNENAGIAFSSSDPTKPSTDITITGNFIDNNGRGMYFLTTQNATITGNTIINTPAPTDGGNSVAIAIYGGDSDFTMSDNNLDNGVKFGFRIAELLGPTAPNSNIQIHQNNITNFAVAGMRVQDPPTSPVDFATCNWWGDASGPTNALNPGGTGEIIDGTVIQANFDPWLLEPAPSELCGIEPPTLEKQFIPVSICGTETSTLIIILNNPNNSSITLSAPMTDTLPDGLEVAGIATTTCNGLVVAPIGGRNITLANGTIPAGSSCSISVKVRACENGTFTNVISAGALQTDAGTNALPAAASLGARGIKNH